MNAFFKRYREEAGFTQKLLAERMDVSVVAVQNWETGKTQINLNRCLRLAELFNVPVDELINEMLIEADKTRKDVWPSFLFDKETNDIVDTLHLNLAQQDLFGLMYIYGSNYLKKTEIDQDTFDQDLKRIPYGFIDRVGSIRFINQAEGLHKVIRYVRSDFLMKVLKQNPQAEFNIKKLPKDLICEFIDEGNKPLNDIEDNPEVFGGLNFGISMRKTKILLPVIEEIGPIHITDGWWSNPLRDDLPEKFLEGVFEVCGFSHSFLKKRDCIQEYNISAIRSGLETVTDYKNTAKKEEHWMLSVNGKGRKLLKWLKE